MTIRRLDVRKKDKRAGEADQYLSAAIQRRIVDLDWRQADAGITNNPGILAARSCPLGPAAMHGPTRSYRGS